MYPPKSFFHRLVESAFLFALAAWLVRTGICFLQDVWGIIVLLLGLAAATVAAYRLWKHKKDTKF